MKTFGRASEIKEKMWERNEWRIVKGKECAKCRNIGYYKTSHDYKMWFCNEIITTACKAGLGYLLCFPVWNCRSNILMICKPIVTRFFWGNAYCKNKKQQNRTDVFKVGLFVQKFFHSVFPHKWWWPGYDISIFLIIVKNCNIVANIYQLSE